MKRQLKSLSLERCLLSGKAIALARQMESDEVWAQSVLGAVSVE